MAITPYVDAHNIGCPGTAPYDPGYECVNCIRDRQHEELINTLRELIDMVRELKVR